jgi:Kef-type K+ transport system membrane component KefB
MTVSRRTLAIYLTTLVLFGGGILALCLHGPEPSATSAQVRPSVVVVANSYGHFLLNQLQTPAILLLVQIIVILLFSKLFSLVMRPFGQPTVVMEILAGVVLGPSVIGFIWPGFTHHLFPASSFSTLQALSQIGLMLYMFVVGMQLDTKMAREHSDAAMLVSHASMICPFFFGVVLARGLYSTCAPPGVHFLPFALFMGIAMSVTAFPVLARILRERGMSTTAMGSLALTCAAIGDLTAWCLLAAVVAIAQHGPLSIAYGTVLASALYLLTMMFVVRPLLERLFSRSSFTALADKTWMALILVYLLLSSLMTELIGIHALFGAFVAGLAMPKLSTLRSTVTERVEYTSEIVLLPLFFALTGLRTQIGLLTHASDWMICLLIILVAVVGKGVGGILAARGSAIPWRDSLLLGVLLNTRGLMELVILNIGYDLGILSPAIFTMLVIMALATTCMTGPLVTLLTRKGPTRMSSDLYRAIPGP